LIWLKEQYKKDKNKWFSSKEIAKGINQGINSATNNLMRLRRNNMLNSRISEIWHNAYEYQHMDYRKF